MLFLKARVMLLLVPLCFMGCGGGDTIESTPPPASPEDSPEYSQYYNAGRHGPGQEQAGSKKGDAD